METATLWESTVTLSGRGLGLEGLIRHNLYLSGGGLEGLITYMYTLPSHADFATFSHSLQLSSYNLARRKCAAPFYIL